MKENTGKNVSTVVHAETTQPVITWQEYVTVHRWKEEREHYVTKVNIDKWNINNKNINF